MIFKAIIFQLTLCVCLNSIPLYTTGHDIIFCGERIPVNDKFVEDKLMNIIKKQINNVNVPELRQRVKQYMSIIEYYLEATGLPEDFKYLAIVESGFKNLVSSAGAAGFWQLMPATARELGLVINGTTDERNDVNKSTYAACKVLATSYLFIRKKFGISSWVLTAASYNTGIGNIKNAITRMGTNYFQMELNAETAAYVYKIIAVKELFEYPEIYMKDFGFNIFNKTSAGKSKKANNIPDTDKPETGGMTVKVNENDGEHPLKMAKRSKSSNVSAKENSSKVKFVSAEIIGKYKNFKDGGLISLKLTDDLLVGSRFSSKMTKIQGRGWIIDNRVMVDLGYEHSVILCDLSNEKGIPISSLKDSEKVILKVINTND